MDHVRTVEELKAAMAGGAQPKFVFFWGHKPSADGSVTKSCFSQWWVAPFVIDGITYPTAEHYMMASKAKLFDDEAAWSRIVVAKHPKQAKQEGRRVSDFDEAIWVQHRFDFVVAGNHAKFSQHPELARFLLLTGQRVLVEASPVDRIWGIGLAADDDRASDPARVARFEPTGLRADGGAGEIAASVNGEGVGRPEPPLSTP